MFLLCALLYPLKDMLSLYAAHRLKDKKIMALGLASFGPVDVNEESKTYVVCISSCAPSRVDDG